MRKINLILAAVLFLSTNINATNHYINAGNYYYAPALININTGDTVTWINDGGYHNVNFNFSSITGNSFNNPTSFISAPTTASNLYTYVFNIPGYYQYDCSVGSHANNGMTASITVNNTINTDCNGIVNGTSILDDCGECQQAYIYNFITHTATLLNDTFNIITSWNEFLVMPDDPQSPYWNSFCIDCNGIVNGTSIIDDCGECQQAYLYNFVTHAVILLDDTNDITIPDNNMIVMPNDPQNSYLNSSCVDCNGIVNGTSIIDDCGECQQAYIYNYVTHAVTLLDDTAGVVTFGTNMIVMPDDPQNPNWNTTCKDCNGISNGTSVIDDCGV